MNPNVLASYALLGRLRDHGVTHAVISPGSRSTPLAFVAYELFDATVVIDERDAGFIALGISESSGQPAVVITTSGSAPTHLFPSVVEAFHSNVGMIVITADRPHEVRGRGAPQTIDQFNMFGSATRYFYDARTPHEEDGVDYWEARADELFDVADGSRNVVGPAHLNMGMNEPLSPDGDEKQIYEKSRTGLVHEKVQTPSSFGFGLAVSSQVHIDETVLRAINAADKAVITVGRNHHCDETTIFELAQSRGWPVLADSVSNLRGGEVITTYDAIMRTGDAKDFIPDLVLELGDPLTSKKWNEEMAGVTTVAVKRFDDGRDPYGHHTHSVVTDDVLAVLGEMVIPGSDPGNESLWKKADAQIRETISILIAENPSSEPAVMSAIATCLNESDSATSVLVASSMPIRNAEWFWSTLSDSVTLYSHRGANGIDGMLSSAFGIAKGSSQPVIAVVGDVAFAHDIGFLHQLSHLMEKKNLRITFVVVDNDGGAIFRHLPQASNETLKKSYDNLFKTSPGIDIQATADACRAQYYSGTFDECITSLAAINKDGKAGVHVVHIKVDHESGPNFMKMYNDVVAKLTLS